MDRTERLIAIVVGGLVLTSSVWGFGGRRAHSLLMPEVERHLEDLEQNAAQYSANEDDFAAPVAVSIESGGSKLDRDVRSAIDNWNHALHEKAILETSSSPTATVILVPEVKYGDDQVAGKSEWTREADGRLCATVYVRTKLPNGRPMPAQAVVNAAAHEFGHLLGLEDNPECGGVMSALDMRHPRSGPNPQEAEAVRGLRHRLQSDISKG